MDVAGAYERVLASGGVVFLVGGMDVGKTTFAIELLRRATEAGLPAGLVDADIGQSSVGPPATVGLKLCAGMRDVTAETISQADALAFVGSISPRGHLLPLVTGTGKLVRAARDAGCRLVVVDTTSFISGIYGQLLKFHKMDLVGPDHVVAFERGGELDPIVSIARRFTAAQVFELEVDPEVGSRTVEDRMAYRRQRFASYFANGISRWRVKRTVFVPALPAEFDLSLLDGLIVGIEDGKGASSGIGLLEYDAGEDLLRMVSPVTEGVRGLRLGSMRIDLQGNSKGAVQLRDLFRTE